MCTVMTTNCQQHVYSDDNELSTTNNNMCAVMTTNCQQKNEHLVKVVIIRKKCKEKQLNYVSIMCDVTNVPWIHPTLWGHNNRYNTKRTLPALNQNHYTCSSVFC